KNELVKWQNTERTARIEVTEIARIVFGIEKNPRNQKSGERKEQFDAALERRCCPERNSSHRRPVPVRHAVSEQVIKQYHQYCNSAKSVQFHKPSFPGPVQSAWVSFSNMGKLRRRYKLISRGNI